MTSDFFVALVYSNTATIGHILYDTREDPEHRRPTREFGSNSRWINRAAPTKASDGNQGTHQGEKPGESSNGIGAAG